MRDEVGACYMLCLASEMSGQMGTPLFTDSVEAAMIGQPLLFESEPRMEVSEQLLRIGISLPGPQEMHGVSMRALADFVERRASERRLFREAVEGIIRSARSIGDPNAIEDYMQTEGAKIVDAVRNLRATLDELYVGSAHSIATITVPTSAIVTVAVSTVSSVAAAILGATGLAITAISCFAATRGKLREVRVASPYHYLLSIDSEFGVESTRAGP